MGANNPNSPHQFPHLILWNARSLYGKLNQLKKYIYSLQPLIVCITETHLKPKYSPKFQNYNSYRKDRGDGYGGLLVLCHKSITVKANNLKAPQDHEMESLSIKYNFQNKWSTLILLYNPCKPISESEFEFYFDQVHETGLICGDINAHHQSWETTGPKPNSSGKTLFSILNRSVNLRLQNCADHPTRIDPQTGKTSAAASLQLPCYLLLPSCAPITATSTGQSLPANDAI